MTIDFNDIIHGERGKLLQLLPKGSRSFCSAGCAGTWYFEWVKENYGSVDRHYGVELYSPKPHNLPSYATWIENSVSDMHDVPSATIDMLFSGQNIEHLYRDDLEGFLREANRVVTPGGYFCMDSPNRAVTQELGYVQPQHVLELTVDEACELVGAAGFSVENVYGIWSCGTDTKRYASVTEFASEDEVADRCALARNDPSRSFIWWIVARRTGPVSDDLTEITERIMANAFPAFVRARFRKLIGRIKAIEGSEAIVSVGSHEHGCVFYGPYIPLVKGDYLAEFMVKFHDTSGFISVDTACSRGEAVLSRMEVPATNIGAWTRIEMEFSLPDYTDTIETRLIAHGAHFDVRLGSQILRV
ncbi:MAG: hypothetical protein APF82_09735 [Sphingomonadales bacterium BRH_c42]|nr:MAG: hypothetical protein APF82_09735 [Sphingomonadales bacterium BRH_c42]